MANGIKGPGGLDGTKGLIIGLAAAVGIAWFTMPSKEGRCEEDAAAEAEAVAPGHSPDDNMRRRVPPPPAVQREMRPLAPYDDQRSMLWLAVYDAAYGRCMRR